MSNTNIEDSSLQLQILATDIKFLLGIIHPSNTLSLAVIGKCSLSVGIGVT